MRIASIFGLVMAVPVGLLAVSQVSDLEDDLSALTSGPLNLLVNDLTFVFYLLVALVGLALLAAVVSGVLSK